MHELTTSLFHFPAYYLAHTHDHFRFVRHRRSMNGGNGVAEISLGRIELLITTILCIYT